MKKTEDTSEFSEEIRKSKLVKKVIETTRCTAGEAEIALHDNEWDLNTAVNSIIERPNNSEDWMEKKGRKFKKQEVKNVRRYDNRNGGGNRGARTSGGKNEGQNFRKDRPHFPARNGEGRTNRGANGGKNYGANNTALEDQKFPAIDSFDSNNLSKEDNAWKNGPLVFEASSIQQQQQQEPNTPAQPEISPPSQQQRPSIYTSTGGTATHTDSHQPLSFAAVAAAKNKPQPIQAPPSVYAPSQQQNQSHQQSNLEQSHHQQSNLEQQSHHPQLQQTPPSTSTHLNDHLNKSLESPSSPVSQFQHSYGGTTISSAGSHNKSSPPNSIASTSMGLANLNINKEFTDKLKSDIGLAPTAASNVIGISSFDSPKTHSETPANLLRSTTIIRNPPSSFVVEDIGMNQPITHNSTLLQDVEFVSGDLPVVTDFQFGFHASSSPVATSQQQQVAAIASSQMQQQNQHDQYAAEMQRQQQQQQQVAPKQRETSLSFVTSSHVDYPNDLRQQVQQQSLNSASNGSNGVGGNKTQQQASSLPQQHQQQQNSNSILQQAQQQLSQPQQQQQQHPSLQQQQHQMYTAAAAAQFSNFPYPYLYSPVAAANLRDVDQYTTMAPFPYNLNGMGGMNQLDMPMGAMIPPALASTGVNPQGGVLAQLNSQPSHHQSQQQQQAPPPTQHRSSVSERGASNQNNTNLPYQNLGALNNQSTHPRNQSGVVGGLENNSLNNSGSNGVAPPPGFSGPPFLTQPSFQSLFQMPSYAHPTMSFPLLYPGSTPQQRQPQSHQATLIQQQHQRPSEHNPYIDINKYAQQNNIGTTQSNIIPQSVNPSYQGLGGGNGGANNQQQHQRSINQSATVAAAGGMLDNGQYYPQQGNKWNWRGNN